MSIQCIMCGYFTNNPSIRTACNRLICVICINIPNNERQIPFYSYLICCNICINWYFNHLLNATFIQKRSIFYEYKIEPFGTYLYSLIDVFECERNVMKYNILQLPNYLINDLINIVVEYMIYKKMCHINVFIVRVYYAIHVLLIINWLAI